MVSALVSQMWIASPANAITLSEAVNNQLETVSVPCQNLLGDDPSSVLTGNLGSVICQRAVPFPGTPQSSATGSSGVSSLPGATEALLQQAQSKEEEKEAQADARIGAKWTVFLTAEGGTLNRDVSAEEDGFDSNVINVLAGTTYALNASNIVGAALTMQRHAGDYVGGGDFTDQTSGFRLLEIYQPSAQFLIQAVAGLDSVDSQRTRTALFEEFNNGALIFSQSGTPSTDYDYQRAELSLQSSYTLYFGKSTITPQLGLTWLQWDYGTYTESGDSGLELTFHNDKRTSLQSLFGIQGATIIGTGSGVIIPQIELNWKHEFEDKSRQVDVSFVEDTRSKIFTYDTQAADRDFFELSGGMAFVFVNGVQAFVRVQTILGQQYIESNIATLGLNIEL